MACIALKSLPSKVRISGFTVVELIVAVTVLGILVSIVAVAYGGWQQSLAKKAVQSDLNMAANAMETAKNFGGGYPSSIPSTFKGSSSTIVTYYSSSTTDFCIDGVSKKDASIHYFIDTTKGKTPLVGTCATGVPFNPGDPIQNISPLNCPTSRALAVDARDNNTYWVQKLADGKCWMLTNLAYAGGGTNTYGDTSSIANGGSSSSSFTIAYYYIPTGANPTTNPSQPSTSTTGTGQYGYLYNFCGANGGQVGNGACSGSTTTAVNTNVSACPKGWRLPTGNGGELSALNTAVNSGSTTTDAGLRTTWLAQRGGQWSDGFMDSPLVGYYRSSSQGSAANAYILSFASGSVSQPNYGKVFGYSIRCVAA